MRLKVHRLPNSQITKMFAPYAAICLGSLCWASRCPPVLEHFIENLSPSVLAGKPSFVYATAGGNIGRTLSTLESAMSKKGAVVLGVCSIWCNTMAFPKHFFVICSHFRAKRRQVLRRSASASCGAGWPRKKSRDTHTLWILVSRSTGLMCCAVAPANGTVLGKRRVRACRRLRRRDGYAHPRPPHGPPPETHHCLGDSHGRRPFDFYAVYVDDPRRPDFHRPDPLLPMQSVRPQLPLRGHAPGQRYRSATCI